MPQPLRLGALASGRGSNVAALGAAIDRGDLRARLQVVISNNSGAGVLELARRRGVAALHISAKTHADPDAAILAALREHEVEVLVLAGYMKKVSAELVATYEGHAVNIHPGPLPRFGGQGMYGARVHEAVLQAGVAATGPTVHLVTAEYDEGATIAHRPVPVVPGDTPDSLAARVLAAEHDLYWRAIAARFNG